MFHLNPHLATQGYFAHFIGLTFPDIYLAASVKDFLENREEITGTPLLRSWPGLIHSNPSLFYERAVVYFHNVNFYYKPEGDNLHCTISDLTDTLDANAHSRKIINQLIEQQGIHSGDRVYEAWLLFDTKGDYGLLSNVQKISDEEQGESDLEGCFDSI